MNDIAHLLHLTRRTTFVVLVAALVAGLAVVWAPRPAAAETAPTIRNGSFESGLKGWRQVGTRSVTTRVVQSGVSGKRAVRMSAVRKSTIKLDDTAPMVRGSAKGTTYRLTAWVRGGKGTMKGQLRLRETGRGATLTHRADFTVRGSRWRKVTLTATTKRAGATLDVNVTAVARRKQSLFVDAVSASRVSGTRSAAATRVPAKACTGRALDARGVNRCGTLFGATVGANSDPATFESQVGARLGVRRTFWSAKQVDSAVRTARSDIAHGRQPWISFKLPYSWEQMSAGKGDAWARDLAVKLRSVGGPVWVAFHHEPEGDGDIKAWTAMQRRLAPLVRDAAPNVAYSIILTGWNQLYGPAPYRMDAIWPKDTKIDIAGFDVYNWYGTPKNGKIEKRTEDLDARYFQPISRWAKSKGVAWGIAETGYTHAADKADPNWMGSTYAAIRDNGGIAMAYFNTPLNNFGASWPLTTESKQASFAKVLRSAPRPH